LKKKKNSSSRYHQRDNFSTRVRVRLKILRQRPIRGERRGSLYTRAPADLKTRNSTRETTETISDGVEVYGLPIRRLENPDRGRHQQRVTPTAAVSSAQILKKSEKYTWPFTSNEKGGRKKDLKLKPASRSSRGVTTKKTKKTQYLDQVVRRKEGL